MSTVAAPMETPERISGTQGQRPAAYSAQSRQSSRSFIPREMIFPSLFPWPAGRSPVCCTRRRGPADCRRRNPAGRCRVTVHLYQDGRPVPHMVIAAEEPEPVLGTDAQGLVGNGVKSVDQLQNPILVALILLGAWDMSRILPAGNRIVKGHAERGRNQKQDGKREGGKENNKRHLFTRFKPAPSA